MEDDQDFGREKQKIGDSWKREVVDRNFRKENEARDRYFRREKHAIDCMLYDKVAYPLLVTVQLFYAILEWLDVIIERPLVLEVVAAAAIPIVANRQE
nr:hypothetical protein Itr_chr06CG17700 [Ipomoea trifida]GME05759.1 hypothetical protein Iba_scaffold3316CG0060 [Ipomoea batatas]